MIDPDFDALIDAVSAAIDLPIPMESRSAVAANLARLHALAAEVMTSGIPADRSDAGPQPKVDGA